LTLSSSCTSSWIHRSKELAGQRSSWIDRAGTGATGALGRPGRRCLPDERCPGRGEGAGLLVSRPGPRTARMRECQTGRDAGEPAKQAAGDSGQTGRTDAGPAQGTPAGQLECRPVPSILASTLLLRPNDLNTGLGCYMSAGKYGKQADISIYRPRLLLILF
jgi:hypothetical protein